MSGSVLLPPDNAPDTSSISIPSDNIVSPDAANVYRSSRISTVQSITVQSDDKNFPFYNYAVGIIKRAAKARIRVIGASFMTADTSDTIPWVSEYILAENVAAAIRILCDFMAYVYDDYVIGETSLPYHPRNLGFVISALANNRVFGTGTQMVLERVVFTKGNTSDTVLPLVSQFFRIEHIGYELICVPATESGVFISYKNNNPAAETTFNKLTLEEIGSSYVYSDYNGTNTSYELYDYVLSYIPAHLWWFKASVAVRSIGTPPSIPLPVIPEMQTYRGIAVPAPYIQQLLLYQDSFQDVAIVVETAFKTDEATDFFQNVVLNVNTMAKQDIIEIANLPSGFAMPYPWNVDTGLALQYCCNLVNLIYAPFLSWDALADLPIDQDQLYQLFYYYCNFKGPFYMPSVLTETFSIHTDSVIMKNVNNGLVRSVQYLHKAKPILTTDNVPVTVNALVETVNTSLEQMTMRRFMKLNYIPENRPQKAFLPYFCFNALTQRNGLPATVHASPYQQKYIDENNLHILTTCFVWPHVLLAPADFVANSTIIDMVFGEWTDMTGIYTQELAKTISYLVLDASYGSDGCELDNYFSKVRHSYLGFWQILAGLLPGVISTGANLIKSIFKPSTVEKVSNTVGRVLDATKKVSEVASGATEYVKLAQAGLKSAQLSTVGPPSDGLTIDLPLDKQNMPPKPPRVGKKSLSKPRIFLYRRR